MRVLLATDGSRASNATIHEVAQLLSPKRDTLLIYYSPFGPAKILGYDEVVLKHSRDLLASAVFSQTMSTLPSDWPGGMETIIGSHDPRLEILEVAESKAAGLIVVGARGLGPIKRLLLGSVSHAVAHQAKVPVYIGRAKRGTAPLIRSRLCSRAKMPTQAVAWSIFSHDSPGRRTHRRSLMSVVNTVFPGKLPDRFRNPKRTPEIEAMIAGWVHEQSVKLQTAENELIELASHFPPGLQAPPPLLCEGLAEREIVDAAKREHAGLIIMGSKGSTPWGRMFIGSTADAVMNHAPCSVLLLPHVTAEPTR